VPELTRRSPLAGRDLGMTSQAFNLSALPPMTRFVLRGGETVAEQGGLGLGLTLPRQACRSATRDERSALWLGPDEWLLIAPAEEADAVAATLATALGNVPHSLVEVSHRSIGLRIDGAKAGEALNAGCPLDLQLASFPVGMCTRTLLGKAEIVLWRTGEDAFHLDVARSFADYVVRFLREASLEYEAVP
jgi:sarcosine oxidase subunit gamma